MAKKTTRRDFLKKGISAGVALWISKEGTLGSNLIAGQAFDVIIEGGLIIDGVSDREYLADVGIVGERIQTIGDLKGAQARSVVDASGKIVSPGFIDIHSHTGSDLLINPKAESKVRQGVTTELSGNCGGSEFPRQKSARKDWANLEQLQYLLNEKRIAVNFASLVGNGTVRAFVMGEEMRAPTEKEMELMKGIVAEAMEQGAFGLSTGLEYAPSGFASSDELIKLCCVVARFGGFYSTHIRSEDSLALEAVGESIFIAENGVLPLQISHLKISGNINRWKMPLMIDLIERAHERGLPVTADRYPYTAYSTGLSVFYPKWARDGGTEGLVKRLKNGETRERMKEETIMSVKNNNSWESMLIVGVEKDENSWLEGKRIHEAAAELNQDPYEFACNLLIREEGYVSIVGFGMSDDNTEMVLKHPLVMLGSDGSALAPYGELNKGIPHPRNYGAFPRFLSLYARQKKLVSLPEAVKKMTSMPAAKMGLQDRGIIKKGYFADLVIFDPDSINDRATYTQPKQYPVGIDKVFVNGKVVVDKGEHTGELPGKVLFGPGKKA